MENKKISTIKLENGTKSRLEHLRVYRRETYDEILQKMLDILNIVRANPERARAKLIAIDRIKAMEKRNQREMQKLRENPKSQLSNKEYLRGKLKWWYAQIKTENLRG